MLKLPVLQRQNLRLLFVRAQLPSISGIDDRNLFGLQRIQVYLDHSSCLQEHLAGSANEVVQPDDNSARRLQVELALDNREARVEEGSRGRRRERYQGICKSDMNSLEVVVDENVRLDVHFAGNRHNPRILGKVELLAYG